MPCPGTRPARRRAQRAWAAPPATKPRVRCCARWGAQHPARGSQLFSADGDLNRYVNVYLNDEDVRVLPGLGTALGRGDTIVILPAMAGG